MVALAQRLVGGGAAGAEAALVELLCAEIGRPAAAAEATFAAAAAALDAELVLPLRALNEGIVSMTTTFNGAPVPRKAVEACVGDVTRHVLNGSFAAWRYSNAVGAAQLAGLSDAQIAVWREPTSVAHTDALRTHEDAAGELGFFWATKIGGPSHGFDLEGQCLLPLLANARHKVILVSDADGWPHHPAGRAHFRMLWTASSPPRPLLWLETVNMDFEASGACMHACSARDLTSRRSTWTLRRAHRASPRARGSRPSSATRSRRRIGWVSRSRSRRTSLASSTRSPAASARRASCRTGSCSGRRTGSSRRATTLPISTTGCVQ